MLSYVLALTTLFLVIPTTIYFSVKKDLWSLDWFLAAMLWTYMAHDCFNALVVLSKGIPA